MAENIDLRELLRDHSNKWIALSAHSDKIVGVADSPAEALEQANQQLRKDIALLQRRLNRARRPASEQG